MTFLKVLISENIVCVYLPSPEETQADGRHLGDDLPWSRRSAHPHPLPFLSRVQHWTEVHLLRLLHWQNRQWVSPASRVILCLCLVIFCMGNQCSLMCVRVIKGTLYYVHAYKKLNLFLVRLSSLWRPDGRRGLQTVGPWSVCEGRQLAPLRGQHRQQLCEFKLFNWCQCVKVCDQKYYIK